VYVHKHRSSLSSDQFFFHELFLQSRDEKFKSPTVNINYEGNLQNSQVLPPNTTRSKFFPSYDSPTTTYYCTLVSRVCLYLSLYSQFRPEEQIIQTLLMDTSRHCWRARRECCSLLLGSGWNLGPHGRENTALGVGTPPPPRSHLVLRTREDCFENAVSLISVARIWGPGFQICSASQARWASSIVQSRPLSIIL
jgi:hypothetical protein